MRHTLWLLVLLTACLDPAAPPFAEPAPGAQEEDPEPSPSPTPRRQPLYEGGLVGVWTWQLPSDGEVRSTAAFSASFWAVLDEGEPGEGGVALAIPDGLDSCAATAWTAAQAEVTGGRPQEQEPRDAGTNTHVACEALNDGAFTIPAEHLAGFPAGAELRLVLGQPRSGRFEVGNVTVDTGTGAGAEASGWVP